MTGSDRGMILREYPRNLLGWERRIMKTCHDLLSHRRVSNRVHYEQKYEMLTLEQRSWLDLLQGGAGGEWPEIISYILISNLFTKIFMIVLEYSGVNIFLYN
jgi:hypothetical protein